LLATVFGRLYEDLRHLQEGSRERERKKKKKRVRRSKKLTRLRKRKRWWRYI
jgi:hypothetical protein